MSGQLKARFRRLQGEGGAAFLLTLLFMGSIMLFAVFLLTATQNASQQASTTSGLLEARLVAEAGIDAYTHLLETQLSTDDVVNVNVPDAFTHELDDGHSFVIENITTSLNGDRLTITFDSRGIAAKSTQTVTHAVTVTP